MNIGKIVQIIGPVLDLQFTEENIPAIYNALIIEGVARSNAAEGNGGKKTTIVAEVQQHLGDGQVRAVSMGTTDGLRRGMEVVDTGQPIAVPVGEEVLGRLFNVIGEPIDNKGPVKAKKTSPI